MTRGDIIRLAQEASSEHDYDFPNIFALERFADLVAAAERDRMIAEGQDNIDMSDRQRLEAIVDVVVRYLPPHGIPINDAMSEIIRLVDPLPDPQRRKWIGLTDEEFNDCLVAGDPCENLAEPEAWAVMKEVEAKLKEKNSG